MPKKFSNDLPFPTLRRLRQLNNSYCGPAVLEMLYSFLGESIGQEQIVQAANIARKIRSHGMLIEEMALAVKTLTPQYNFWFKRQATINELSEIVNKFRFPVGVEWQGLFQYKGGEDDDDDDDPGHYSVVTKISISEKEIYLADPFRVYAGKDRRFTLLQFERRWWDINEVINPVNHRKKQVDDYHVMFVITPVEDEFPEKFGMKHG